ncbi:MAG: leucine dehydrogenase, partial [Bacillota bacterium]
VKRVIEISKRDGIRTWKAADVMAEERIAQIRNLKGLTNSLSR